jgi:DMSO/TMAO reductase YedYZ molybdopterin-dependent catalytic subunit
MDLAGSLIGCCWGMRPWRGDPLPTEIATNPCLCLCSILFIPSLLTTPARTPSCHGQPSRLNVKRWMAAFASKRRNDITFNCSQSQQCVEEHVSSQNSQACTDRSTAGVRWICSFRACAYGMAPATAHSGSCARPSTTTQQHCSLCQQQQKRVHTAKQRH